MRNLVLAAIAAALTGSAATAATVVQYRQTTSEPTLELVNGPGNTSTLSDIGNPIVRVTLFDPNNPASQFVTDARFDFLGNDIGAATTTGNFVTADIASGSFSLTALSSFTFLGNTGTNILSGSFLNGRLSGDLGSRNPSVTVSSPNSTIFDVESDFLDLSRFSLDNFSLATSGGFPPLALDANGNISPFSASSVGTFDVLEGGGNPFPTIPEPGTWSMLIAGFGMVGIASRRRKRNASVVS